MATVPTATVRPQSWRRATPATSLWRTPRTRGLLLVGTLGLAGAIVALLARVYTDLLWYRELGQERVLWTTLLWRVLVPATAGLGTASALLLTLGCALRGAVPTRTGGVAAVIWRRRPLVVPAVAIGGGVVAVGRLPPGAWKLALLWAHRGSFGATDPLFHRDIGFFIFSLPLHRALTAWLLQTLLMAIVATAGAYAVTGDRRRAQRHLFALAALLLAVVAWRLRLDEYALELPHAGSAVPGASYTDVHVRLPLLRVRGLLALAGAAACLYGATRRVPLAPLAAVGLAAVVTVFGTSALPQLIERFGVQPQVLARERPYVGYAIAATRSALALDRIDVRPLPAGDRLTARDVARDRATLANVPAWDPPVLRAAMNELQSIGAYYRLANPTVDRYKIGGTTRLVTVAARQLGLGRLPPAARSWANGHFAYTHGYGVVAALADGVDGDGYPRFAQRAFGRAGNVLDVNQPRSYYGRRSAGDPAYVVTASGRAEVDRPAPGSQAPTYHYDGGGGITLSGLVRRAAFAARFGDLRLLLTRTVTGRSRIMVRRGARERVRALAPFLRWDERPDTVVADGRVWFLLHGYTTSAGYPYAARVPLRGREVNYVRGSAIAAVDAFSGATRLYAAEPDDPLLAAWQRAYPSLFQPLDRMPPLLREHLRYPPALFEAQAAAYATYHAADPTGFWNGADAWERSRELAGPVEDAAEIHFSEGDDDPDARGAQPAASSSLLARLPGDAQERFLLTTSFTPRGRQNLVAYLAGSVDGSGVPRLTVLSLPRDRLTVGPSQATRQIIASHSVTRQLELLNRESRDLGRSSVGRTVLGAARLVPVGRALVHIQPVYVTAGGSSLPRLQLVTAYANGRVGEGRDVATAVRRLLR